MLLLPRIRTMMKGQSRWLWEFKRAPNNSEIKINYIQCGIYIYFFYLLMYLPFCCPGSCRSSPVTACRCCSSWQCLGCSLWGLLLLQSAGSLAPGSAAMAPGGQSAGLKLRHMGSTTPQHKGSPDQGWNLRFLDWQADSVPPSHQGSPVTMSFNVRHSLGGRV